MNKIIFLGEAWDDYCYQQHQDKKIIKKINILIKDIQRNYFKGIGKPEPLKGNYSGYWSRRNDDVNRIVYKITNNTIIIISCKGHYKN